jgi:hypothetical protein
MDYIIREIAKAMDLDPDKVTNSLQDAVIQSEIFKKFQEQMPQQQQAPQPAEGQPAPAGANVQDATGGGGSQIGTGTAPAPGEEGFTGNV